MLVAAAATDNVLWLLFRPVLCLPHTIEHASSGAPEIVRQPKSAPARGDPSKEDHRGRGQAHLVFPRPGSSGLLPGVDSEPTQGSARGSPSARGAGIVEILQVYSSSDSLATL